METRALTLRLPADQAAQLEAVARADGVSVSEAVRARDPGPHRGAPERQSVPGADQADDGGGASRPGAAREVGGASAAAPHPDRVYAEDRLLHPLVRVGAKGAGASSARASLGRGARRRRRRPARGGRRRTAASRSSPTATWARRARSRAARSRYRLMHALGASELERTICATAGIAGVVATHGALARGRPGGVAARALPARVGLEPAVDRAAPVAQAAGGAPRRRAARRRRPVPQPHGARRRRAPAAAAGHRRGARARDDARGRRRRPRRRGVVPRARGRLRRAARAAGRADGRAVGRRVRRRRRRRSRASPATSRARSRRCCGSASARSATSARRRLPHDRVPAGARRRVAPSRRRLLVHPDRDRGGGRRAACCAAPSCGRARSRTINMSQLGAALTDPRSTRRSRRSSCWSSNPAQIAPDQQQVLAGLRREDLFTLVLEQFMTDTAAHADVSCRRRRSSSTSTPSSPGATTTSRSTSRRSRRSARRSRRPRRSGCWPRASASTTRCSARPTRSCSSGCSPTRPAA